MPQQQAVGPPGGMHVAPVGGPDDRRPTPAERAQGQGPEGVIVRQGRVNEIDPLLSDEPRQLDQIPHRVHGVVIPVQREAGGGGDTAALDGVLEARLGAGATVGEQHLVPAILKRTAEREGGVGGAGLAALAVEAEDLHGRSRPPRWGG